MLTKEEEDYLSTIDPNRKVNIYPYNNRGKEIAEQIIANIKSYYPDIEVMFMGSTALGIAGQRDIDIYILCKVDEFPRYLTGLSELFGDIKKSGDYVTKKFIEWKLNIEGYEIEIYLTEPPERQIKVFKILENDPNILKEYENLKLRFDGQKYVDYQRAKYEFFNKILN